MKHQGIQILIVLRWVGIQVLFSKKCILQVSLNGTIVCQVQLYDVNAAHGICEAHVQLYALMRHKDYDGHPHLVQL